MSIVITPADRGILLAAAATARRETCAQSAVSSVLGFLDRFPSALDRLDAAAHLDRRVSLALSLLGRCKCARDVAVACQAAAFPDGEAAAA